MSDMNKKLVSGLVDVGNGVNGHRVTGKTKAETKKNITRVFANARKRQKATHLVG
jgi:hypothetical protein